MVDKEILERNSFASILPFEGANGVAAALLIYLSVAVMSGFLAIALGAIASAKLINDFASLFLGCLFLGVPAAYLARSAIKPIKKPELLFRKEPPSFIVGRFADEVLGLPVSLLELLTSEKNRHESPEENLLQTMMLLGACCEYFERALVALLWRSKVSIAFQLPPSGEVNRLIRSTRMNYAFVRERLSPAVKESEHFAAAFRVMRVADTALEQLDLQLFGKLRAETWLFSICWFYRIQKAWAFRMGESADREQQLLREAVLSFAAWRASVVASQLQVIPTPLLDEPKFRA
jgi:hypothetical protein